MNLKKVLDTHINAAKEFVEILDKFDDCDPTQREAYIKIADEFVDAADKMVETWEDVLIQILLKTNEMKKNLRVL